MNAAPTSTQSPQKLARRKFYLLSSILALSVILFLFYIDEGYYNFQWMRSLGNWLAFFIYLIPVIVFQWLIFRLMPKSLPLSFRAVASVMLGLGIGLFTVIVILSS